MDLVRNGIGYDIHRLEPGRPLVIAGVDIPDAPIGAVAHSDGDVAIHALCDALLGSVGLPDIGHYFPDTDPEWKDADSADLLSRVVELLADVRASITSVDITVVLERPKIGPFRDQMRERLASILQLPVDRIGLKATTNEQLGPVGNAEGVAAFASASIVQIVETA